MKTRIYTQDGVTTVERSDLGIVAATYHRQGNWRVRLYVGPDEWFGHHETATREAAELLALRHAALLVGGQR